MNLRDRFLANMAFEPAAPPPKWEFGYWAGTIRRWYNEGLVPKARIPEGLGAGESVRAEVMGAMSGELSDSDVHELLGLDAGFRRIPLNNFVYPPFPSEILEDHGDWVLRRDSAGILRRERKDRATPDALVAGPVSSRLDWERLKEERLQPNSEGRLPANWAGLCADFNTRDYPLILGGRHGFYGTPRYLIGDERLLMTFYDDPQLIRDINSHLCSFWIELYDKVLQDTTADVALIWEDMCYKNGPLISPTMFEEFLLPYYRRLTGFFRDHGIHCIFVDTDGDCRKLIPLFLAGGVSGVYPLEVNAGMEVHALREAFPTLQMIGGVNKMKLMDDAQTIAAEVEKVTPLLARGGYIPTVDHLVPPDVSWANFVHYRTRLNELIDATG